MKHHFAQSDDSPELSESHLVARVCWYYFIGALTQQEIADRLGQTRFKVNKIIRQARSEIGRAHV